MAPVTLHVPYHEVCRIPHYACNCIRHVCNCKHNVLSDTPRDLSLIHLVKIFISFHFANAFTATSCIHVTACSYQQNEDATGHHQKIWFADMIPQYDSLSVPHHTDICIVIISVYDRQTDSQTDRRKC